MAGNLGNLKHWTCENGHVLGVIRRDKAHTDSGREFWVSRLMLFREAVDLETVQPENVDVMALIEGTTLDVRCSVPGCGCSRTWWAGDDAYERLRERMRSPLSNNGG